MMSVGNIQLTPGEEILLPDSPEDVVRYLSEMDEAEKEDIGRNAQQRVLAEHTARRRAEQFEEYVGSVAGNFRDSAAFSSRAND